MIRKVLIAASLVVAACAGGNEAAEGDEVTTAGPDPRLSTIETAVRLHCIDDGETEESCACLSEALVTDLSPELVEVFHTVIEDGGAEALNRGDWLNGLSDELREQASAHAQNVRSACS